MPNDDVVSKSQRKRELDELKQLGVKLLDFSEDSLRRLDLPEQLLEAVLTGRKITSHGARKRQLQYIGKLLKVFDATSVREAVAAREHQHDTATREFQRLEALRERLLAAGDDAVPAVLELFPRADRARLRKLVRQARQQQATGQPAGATRALFRYLRDLQGAPGY
ncbi:MAG: ribosome biogenesis factor YjgA [Gammaproteobacteria bacterium]|jgi:ribosome-associated protein